MIRFIEDASERRKISRQILEALPEWFEVEESREQYIRESAEQPFWAFVSEDENQGFLCLKETGKATMELAVMGVRKECPREGIGRRLFAAAKDYAAAKGYEFIQVKTVRSGVYADYDITNAFYQSLGFKELEVFPKYWDKATPPTPSSLEDKSRRRNLQQTNRREDNFQCRSRGCARSRQKEATPCKSYPSRY